MVIDSCRWLLTRLDEKAEALLLLCFYFPIALPEAKAGNRQGREDNVPVPAVRTRPLTPFFIAPPAHPALDGSNCGSVLSGVHSRALDGPTAAARLSIAFLSNKKGTHEKDMGEGPLLERLGG